MSKASRTQLAVFLALTITCYLNEGGCILIIRIIYSRVYWVTLDFNSVSFYLARCSDEVKAYESQYVKYYLLLIDSE